MEFKTKFNIGEQVVFFNKEHDTKKFLGAVVGKVKSIKISDDE